MDTEQQTFIQIIEYAPLVSIDLVLHNEHNEVLLGLRRNRPAQNYWFVPGGRIRKNEAIQTALTRIARTELSIVPDKGRLLGAFDHFYKDNYFALPDVTTHYVVLAYEITLPGNTAITGDDQHTQFKWWSVKDLLADSRVHDNTKLYFRTVTDNGFRIDDATLL